MATTTPTPAEDMATRLVANALGTAGTDLFVDFEPPNLVNSITTVVYNSGGFDPDVLPGKTFDRPTVQFVVIGQVGRVKSAQQRAQAIKELLHATRFVVGTTRYAGAYLQGDIVPLGTDEKRRPRYSLNMRLQRTYA